MDNRVLLAKSVCLLYRESQLANKSENSADLVRTVLENVKVTEYGLGVTSEREIILALKATILEMCDNPLDHIYDLADLVQRIKLNCQNDDKLCEAICENLKDEMSEGGLKRSIVNMQKSIHNHFREQQINSVLTKASSTFRFEREKIKDINQFIAELMAQLEPLHINGHGKDPAVMGDIDIGNDQAMKEIFTEMKKISTGKKVYKTGWQGLNDALQGGFRPGECTVIGALQHKYKTGLTLSLFAQIAQYNKPFTEDPNKKPLLLRISFEDDLVSNLQFLYQYLKYDEVREPVFVENVSIEEMTEYVKNKLQATGFNIKMLRVDPSQWTYKSICNKVIELEAQGYSVEVLMLDYLAKVPTTGCIDNGPIGNDVMDQLSRLRMFCSSKGICFINPHQLSTEAKGLIRGGVPEDQFVKEIAEKGFWERTKGLDRVYDLALLIHLFKFNKETYLSIYREKHRLPTIIDDALRYMLFKFPKGMPIPSDIYRERITFTKMTNAPSNASAELFQLGN